MNNKSVKLSEKSEEQKREEERKSDPRRESFSSERMALLELIEGTVALIFRAEL